MIHVKIHIYVQEKLAKNLINLQELHLEGNNFSQVKIDKLVRILPNCKIFF